MGVERVLYNNKNWAIGLGMRIKFLDLMHENVMEKFDGHSLFLCESAPDGWLVLTSDESAWVFINNEAFIKSGVEVLGEL